MGKRSQYAGLRLYVGTGRTFWHEHTGAAKWRKHGKGIEGTLLKAAEQHEEERSFSQNGLGAYL